ncbi:hypothetical protein [Streptomyces sp. NPDC085529]|uniref:hypothetical protein n=1 Tax=Streptomyces sp. NPDC085529 TaxID=3365729 RepID=UPI0037D3B1F9
MHTSDAYTGPERTAHGHTGHDGPTYHHTTHERPEAEHAAPAYLGSELVDLSDVPLSALRSRHPRLHAGSLERLLRQVERPRVNFAGGSEPPKRFD